LAGRQPQKNCYSRFVKRYEDSLNSRYLNALDLVRYKADSRASYIQRFKIIGNKIEECNITMQNIYNIDEKGSIIDQI
ncbi:hypothetical protein M433DRAFT_43286, partial [Acidomyces richmondensis BFW]